eukprot:COSAG02_NODE_621_length_19442_cov_39.261166_9_plen_115_part_00
MLALGSYVEDLKDLPASGLGRYLDHVESSDGSCLVWYTPTEIGRLRITPLREHKDKCVPVAKDLANAVSHAHHNLRGRVVMCDKRVWFRDDTHQWHVDKERVLVLVANAVGTLS